MRYSMLRAGIAPAIAALLAFVHPPAARAMAVHSSICGPGAGIDMLIERMPRKSGRHDPSCPTACHAICAGRKRIAPGDGMGC